ncbi:MAG: VIT1/CCC1 transporter family protein [Gammaproteobacteria bacterium]|nr:VIT1/CCC1 transporter family protein [Gammaproteobacteria bacterium]
MSALENWTEEMQSAYLYRVLAEVEADPVKGRLFKRLGEAAGAQAGIWAEQITRHGGAPPHEFHPSLRTRVVASLIRTLGPRAIRPVLAAIKIRGLSVYAGAPGAVGHVMPTSVQDFGHRHKGAGSGGNLRAAVFGVNDGLVSNTSLILGVAGAISDPKLILLSGVAGLLAGALSMAAGEYISMRSQREMYEYQIGLEREELEQYPDEEAEELALIYHARGADMEQARSFAQDIIRNPEHALASLAREELGLNPDDLGSAWGAAFYSFFSFGIGAVIPLLPFLLHLSAAVSVSAGLAAVSLFAVGATLSLFTGRQALWGGLRMVLIGGGAGVAAYSIGALLGG